MSDAAAYASLFLSALLSATILPGTSEATFAFFLNEGRGAPLVLLIVAIVGNVLGAIVNWILGRFFTHYRDRKWFPLKEGQYERAKNWYGRYGKWTLLLSWLPIVGDPLTIIAGVMRTHFGIFILLVTLGKAARYTFILQAALLLLG